MKRPLIRIAITREPNHWVLIPYYYAKDSSYHYAGAREEWKITALLLARLRSTLSPLLFTPGVD